MNIHTVKRSAISLRAPLHASDLRNNVPALYHVEGPIGLPFQKSSKVKQIDIDSVKSSLADAGPKRGCYIFGLRGSHGSIKPFYVGKTAKSFEAECFTYHKLIKYNDVLFKNTHGTPIMMLVIADVHKGAFNKTALKALEEYLIGLGLQANAGLKNIRGTKQFEPPFQIKKIHSQGAGKLPASVAAFKRAFAIR